MPKTLKQQRWLQCRAYYKLAIQLLKQHNYESSCRVLLKIVWMNASDPLSYFLIAQCLNRSGKSQQSKKFSAKALEINGCFSFFHVKQEQFSNALNELSKSIFTEQNQPFFSEKRINSLKAYFGDNYGFVNSLELCQIIDEMKEDSQKDGHYHTNLGFAYYEAARYPQAIQQINKSIQHSETFRGYNNFSILLYCNNQIEKSLESVKRALSLNPGYARSQYISSFCYHKLQQLDQALIFIKRSITKNPQIIFYKIKYLCLLVHKTNWVDFTQIKSVLDDMRIMIKNRTKDSTGMLLVFYQSFVTYTVLFLHHYFNNVIEEKKDDIIFLIKYFDEFLLHGNCRKYTYMIKIKKIQQKLRKQYGCLNLSEEEQIMIDKY